MNDNFVNNHTTPHTSEYTLDIIDKTTNEIILIYNNKNVDDLIEIMNGFIDNSVITVGVEPLSKFDLLGILNSKLSLGKKRHIKVELS